MAASVTIHSKTDMNKLFKYLFFSVLLMICSCSSRYLQELPDTDVPKEAETAILISSVNADSLFSVVQDSLIHHGYLIKQSNKQLFAISTRSRNIGNNKQMRMSFLIEPLDNRNSRMTVRAEWRSIPNPDSSKEKDAEDIEAMGWQGAQWSDPEASRKTFANLVKFIINLPHENITYN
jgi:hypothetical protein